MSKIMLVDDDDGDALLIRKALTEQWKSVEIICVTNGAEAIEYLTANNEYPDLILLDLNMPVKDGRETLRALKMDEKFRKIPVVVHSTSGSELDLQISYGLGCNGYVTKPALFSDLKRTLNSVFEYWLNVNRHVRYDV